MAKRWEDVFTAKITTLAGVPDRATLAASIVPLLTPVLGLEIRVDQGPTLTSATGLAPLLEFMEHRPNLTARGKQKLEVALRWSQLSAVEPMSLTGSLGVFARERAVDVEAWLEAMATAMRVLQAPFGYLSPWVSGYRDRNVAHRDRYQDGLTGQDRVFGLGRGFGGIPWRTLLGPSCVEFFGTERLRRLPASLARPIDDRLWLLTPCRDPAEWDPAAWCEGEAAIIDALGRECFFDPATGALPSRTPVLPEVAPIPVKIRSTDDHGRTRWTQHNGYTE